MRLRPTARRSTLRETARPSRGGASSCSQCSPRAGWAMRLPASNTRVNSLRARTRAHRGNEARGMTGNPGWPAAGTARTGNVSAWRRRGRRGSGAEALAALGATAGQDLAAVGRRHAGTEAVVALALEVAGLVRALGGHDGLVRWERAERTAH